MVGTVYVNWVALLDSNIRIEYVSKVTNSKLSTDNGLRVTDVDVYYDVPLSRPLPCDKPVANAFILGGYINHGA